MLVDLEEARRRVGWLLLYEDRDSDAGAMARVVVDLMERGGLLEGQIAKLKESFSGVAQVAKDSK